MTNTTITSKQETIMKDICKQLAIYNKEMRKVEKILKYPIDSYTNELGLVNEKGVNNITETIKRQKGVKAFKAGSHFRKALETELVICDLRKLLLETLVDE